MSKDKHFVVFVVDSGIVQDDALKLLTAKQATKEALKLLKEYFGKVTSDFKDYYKELQTDCRQLVCFSINDDVDIKILEVLQ